jgi:HNH endonuclease
MTAKVIKERPEVRSRPTAEERRRVRVDMKRLLAVHVQAALKRIDDGKPGEFSLSVKYDLIHSGRRYSPKQVVGLALEALTGQSYSPYHFNGGALTSAFRTLQSLGFTILDKSGHAIDGPPADGTEAANDLQHALDHERLAAERDGSFDLSTMLDARRKSLASIVRRQGQGAFREALMNAYDRRCSVTGCDVQTVLEAAHIVPYLGVHTNIVSNGLLLRSDIHLLFDLGLLQIDWKSWRVSLSKDLRTGFYASLHGKKIRLPLNEKDWPNTCALNGRLGATWARTAQQ